jgi:RNA polymerase sigma factor (sigma-70 family)
MEADSGVGSVPVWRTPGRVARYGPGRAASDPGNPDEHAPDERPPVHLSEDRQPVAVLESLLIARGDRLLRAAVMLAGSHADGEDLLQAALERVYRHWRRIDGDPEGYLRRTLYHLAADGWRRNGMLRARLGLLRPSAGDQDETAAVDQRDELIRLLRSLPARQRTAVILRYWEELSEAETARLMGCSVGSPWRPRAPSRSARPRPGPPVPCLACPRCPPAASPTPAGCLPRPGTA